MKRALVLFDVDGTLLLSGGASTRAIHRACRRLFGDSFAPTRVSSGLLDQQIFAELAQSNGIADCSTYYPQYKMAYLAELRDDLGQRNGARALPGIQGLLEVLAGRQNVILGLLTGNYREGANLKLAAVGIPMDLFAMGAYAEDGEQRCDLVPAALARASELAGQPIVAAQTILVGDTPRDIDCARTTGCHAAAVATGHFALDVLQTCGPDVAIQSFENAQPLIRLVDEMSR